MWILPRSPFFHSALEVEDSTLASSWRSDLLASSASLNGTPSPSASWSRRWKRTPWLQLLYGRIWEPSTASRGVAEWIASLPDTPASRSAKPVSVVARMIRATCGPKFIEWCGRYVPPSSFWRTSQGTLDLGLVESSEISESQATELRRLSSGLRMWAHRTNGNGCSSSPSWTTPQGESDAKSNMGAGGYRTLVEDATLWATATAHPRSHDPRDVDHGEQLANQVDQWKTPVVPDGGRHLPPHATETGMVDGVKRQVDLQHQVRLWPTPVVADVERGTGVYKRGNETLKGAATGWPTPGVHNSPDASPNSQRECDLRETVKNWQTPNVMDSSNRMIQNQRGDPTKPVPTLAGQSRSFPQAPVISTPGDESLSTTPASRRRLNPRFVCWLMGWPLIGGNGSDSLETESSHYRQRMRSRLLLLVSD